MPGILEAVVFSHIITPFEVYQRTADLDERIVLRWLIPGNPGVKEFGSPGSTRRRVLVRPKNSTNVTILGRGHLVSFGLLLLLLSANRISIYNDRYLKKRRKSWVCFFLKKPSIFL